MMPQYGSGGNSFLDDVRTNEGAEQCRAVFSEACGSDPRRAAAMINDQRLTFGSLFILLPLVAQFHMERLLSPRNAAALQMLRPEGRGAVPLGSETARAALKWMIETGRADDGVSDEYEEALEIAASVLITVYREMEALPAVIDMIFERSRKGHNIHSLVWAVFQSQSPEVLKLIAQRLRSPDERDARLSCTLLGIDAPENGAPNEICKHYEPFLKWLEENDPFLYFTGESLQYASRPAFYSVDFERRYLHQGTLRYDRQPISPRGEEERTALAAFATLGAEQKALLSEYSHRLHAENPAEWKAWVQRPIEEQVISAKLSRGGSHDYGLRTFV